MPFLRSVVVTRQLTIAYQGTPFETIPSLICLQLYGLMLALGPGRSSGLTSKGHDFFDATRNQSFWIKTKNYVTKNLPGWTLSIIKEVAERGLKGEIHL
jgi:hypothetical protein